MRGSKIAIIALTLLVATGFRCDPLRSAISPYVNQITSAVDRIAGVLETDAVQTMASVARSGQMVARSFTHQYDDTHAMLASAFERTRSGVRTDAVAAPIACTVALQVGNRDSVTTVVAVMSVTVQDSCVVSSTTGPSGVASVLRGTVNRLVRPIVKLGRGLGTVIRSVFGSNDERTSGSEYSDTSNVSTIGG